MLILGIALAGAIGAPARYVLDGYVQSRAPDGIPVGTLVINVTGSLVLGFLTGLALYHAFPATPKTVLGTGFCGAYTTFSTFTYETVRLAEERELSGAFKYLIASLVLPALAAAAGMAFAAL
jgi:fluoride exporter